MSVFLKILLIIRSREARKYYRRKLKQPKLKAANFDFKSIFDGTCPNSKCWKYNREKQECEPRKCLKKSNSSNILKIKQHLSLIPKLSGMKIVNLAIF